MFDGCELTFASDIPSNEIDNEASINPSETGLKLPSHQISGC
jgi:hypothetical protein